MKKLEEKPVHEIEITQRSRQYSKKTNWGITPRGGRHFRNFVHFSEKPGETSGILTESPRIPENPQNPLESPGIP